MIAGVIGLICFGPWGLLVGAVALIIGLWPKYKGIIMATVAAIGVALLAIYSGPVGWVIAGVTALFALVWAFKDKIWGWIEGIGGFIWGAVKSIGALVGKALLFMLLGPIGPLMAAWAVIRKFFPSMGEKIKGAVFGLLSKIPFVGKFFKGKSGEGDGDSEAAEAKASAAQPKGAAKPDVKPPEVSSGVPVGAPKPEASPITRYSAPAAKPAGPVQLPPDVVEKLTSAIRSVRTANLAAAASIIREMKALAAKRAAGVSVSVVNVNNVSVSVANRGEAGVKAALGRLSARVAFVMRAVNTMRNSAGAALARLSAIARSVRGVPFIMGRVRLAVQPIIALMHRMSQQLTMINGSIRLSSASGSLMGTVASAVSQAKSIVGGAFSRVAGAFGLWRGEEKPAQPNPAQLAVGAARTQKAIPDAPEGDEAIVVSGAAAGADVEKSPKGRYEGRDWAVRYVKEKLRKRREARQRMLERDVPDSSLEGAMATMNEIAQIQRENVDGLSGEGGDALGPEASADAVGAGPLVGQKDEIEANGASANAANVNSLVSQKNVIESMKVQNRQISNENKEKAQSIEDGREEKRMAMLPAAICAGLEAFFDGRELTLKGAHEPENILEIGKEDRADDF